MSNLPSIRLKRSLLVTIVALIFLVWGGLAVMGVFVNRAWDPDSPIWHPSDAMWATIYVGGEPTQAKKLMAAQYTAQMRYEVLIWATSTAWSLVTFVAALGLLRRKNWARLLFVGSMASAAAGIIWLAVLFRSLRMAGTSDVVICVVLAVALGSIAWMLLLPSIVVEFRNERP